LAQHKEGCADGHAADGDDGEGGEAGGLVEGDVTIDATALGCYDGGAE
jgi:hypothetical protein